MIAPMPNSVASRPILFVTNHLRGNDNFDEWHFELTTIVLQGEGLTAQATKCADGEAVRSMKGLHRALQVIDGDVEKLRLHQQEVAHVLRTLVDERVVLLDDLSSQVEEAKKEEAGRADSEAEAAARAEESAALVREEAMKSQGKRKNREGDDEAAGGKMLKVLTLMNDANNSELELRKFMFEKELEERQKEREVQARERVAQAKEREAQLQQLQLLQSSMTALISTLVNKL
ncbi:hypothetical protein DYB32_007982 [Aphanomyces invadans]|uniref:Uncharacterized protein n=1 Tax=Aphanomyces invadans TaxID=157072 RepID=A0A418AMG3_9STRA|nr:hypothetical protein DYB32_007982 [Aphanomyces invadans]